MPHYLALAVPAGFGMSSMLAGWADSVIYSVEN